MSSPRKTRVAVVFGGRSTEQAVDQVNAGDLLDALDGEEFEIVPVAVTRDGRWVLPARHAAELSGGPRGEGAVLPRSGGVEVVDSGDGMRGLIGVDVVLPLLHGVFGAEGTIQGLLEMADLPYVGSGVFASSVAVDVEISRRLLAADRLPVVPHAVLREGAALADDDRRWLGLPVSVGPARSTAGIAATRVDDWAALDAAVSRAREAGGAVLVEAIPPGRAVAVGVLGGDDGPRPSVPVHPPADGNGPVPSTLGRRVDTALGEYAVRAFAALDCAGLARVDFVVTEGGDVLVSDVDTMPDLSPDSSFVRAWAASGIEYRELVSSLIRAAQRRGTGLH